MISYISFIKKAIHLIRLPLFRIRKNKVALSATIDNGTFMRDCRIGSYCYIGRNCVLNSTDVGNYSCIAAAVQIGGMEHSIQELSISPTLMGDRCVLGKKTSIGHDVWIGANCIIKQGVTIGDGAVVGANSFVNKDVEPYSIVFGSPAKFYKYRGCKQLEDLLKESDYWNMTPGRAKRVLDGLRSKK